MGHVCTAVTAVTSEPSNTGQGLGNTQSQHSPHPAPQAPGPCQLCAGAAHRHRYTAKAGAAAPVNKQSEMTSWSPASALLWAGHPLQSAHSQCWHPNLHLLAAILHTAKPMHSGHSSSFSRDQLNSCPWFPSRNRNQMSLFSGREFCTEPWTSMLTSPRSPCCTASTWDIPGSVWGVHLLLLFGTGFAETQGNLGKIQSLCTHY